ncbi:MAG: acetyltransferase [Magnetococcales bacterium]|nr:acetyltransferase [Magnetococcales bacterium]
MNDLSSGSEIHRPYCIWGALGHAKVLAESLAEQGRQPVAVFDNNPEAISPFEGVPLFVGKAGFLHWRESWQGGCDFVVAIGGHRGRDRVELGQFLSSHGLTPLTVHHPTAYLSPSADIAPGCQLLMQSAVGVECVLAQGCIINSRASVDHESILAQGVHVAPGATLAGLVRVGAYTLIGAGATILPRIVVGEGAIVGAGAVVTRDVPDQVVVAGNPARILDSATIRTLA